MSIRLIRGAIGIIASLIAVGVVRAEAAKPETTLRARAILRKYCSKCHDSEDKPRGEISVMDRAGMERAERPFLAPGSADASQLLRFIEDGSMPPGTHDKPTAEERAVIKEWINADAASFPRQFDDAYVLSSIAADIKRLPQAERPHVRYFTLHNVVADDPLKIAGPRDALFQAIGDHSKVKDKPGVADPFQMVYRIDLRNTGWDLQPFKGRRVEDKKVFPVDSKVNLFDVILLEYPFGILDAKSPDFQKIAKLFLEPAGQVVPITHVRADWFADTFAKSPVATELRGALDLPAPPPRNPLADRPLPDTRRKATAMAPLDATTIGDVNAPSAEIDLIFEIGYPRNTSGSGFRPNKAFKSGDQISVHLRSTKTVFIEIVWTEETGRCSFLKVKELVGAGDDKYFEEYADKSPLRVEATRPGVNKFTIFASETDFPPGEVLSTKQLNYRVIHPFYPLPGVTTKFDHDPAKVVKKTIEFTIEPKK